ncbi:hypothetical protein AC578_4606 [Pseudocercospora eumusae]|uniref:Asp/Glu/hydantoin racemase n=1 Tax=Pseudocercospora eumusae TaxID=321146 RepID=A0A139H535_9PEZI|nr:hypothetical protein AC578_4606 [Pseudocercospora eumusae]
MTYYEKKILVINPNTTESMTQALKPLIENLHYRNTKFTYFTAPTGVPSINNETDAHLSTEACLPPLKSKLQHDDYNAFLICCYSQHPLIAELRTAALLSSSPSSSNIIITGIFESSIATVLQILNTYDAFGIVSTGAQWREILDDAVQELLGTKASERYIGTETTGLNANELHTAPKEEVDARMKVATKKLLEAGAKAICLGCAGMSGMDGTVREACIELLGEEQGKRIKIVDGVVCGAAFLEGALRAGL